MFHKARYVLRKVSKDDYNDNIFMTQNELSDNHFFKEGKLIPYYIVGSQESFLKQRNSAVTQNHTNQSTKVIRKTENVEKKLDDSSYIKIDMEIGDVEQEIERALHKKNIQKEIKNKLSKGDRMVEQQDQKIMSAFQAREQKWNKRILKSAQACNRPPQESLYHHIDAARAREEDKQLLEIIQSDAEKYGNKLWEMQLRSESNPSVQVKAKNLEFVSKPNSANVYKRPAIYDKKFEEKKELVQQIVPSKNVKEMEIVGENKLVKEAATLLYMIKSKQDGAESKSTKRKRQSNAPYIKLKLKEQPMYYQEVLEMNYDKKLLRQQGKLDIFKQIF